MLVYEKNNKLNINFDNEVSEQPDLQINKEDGKTSITVDGKPISSGSIEPVIVTANLISETEGTWSGATWEELTNAFMHNIAGIDIGDEDMQDIRWFTYITPFNDKKALCVDITTSSPPLILRCVSDGTLTTSMHA